MWYNRVRCYALSTENNTNRGLRPQKAQNIAPKNRASTRQGVSRPQRGGTARLAATQNARPRTAEKPKPTPEQIDAARKRKAMQERLRRERRETFLARLSLCLIIYVIFCLFTALFVYSLYTGGSAVQENRLVIADSDGKAIEKISALASNIDGCQYVSASQLALLYKFTIAGDKEQVTLYFHNIDQSISLFKDSSAVEINGATVRLSSNIIFTDDYYIPIELIENYFYGAIIKRESGVTTLSRGGENDGLTLRVQSPAPAIPA